MAIRANEDTLLAVWVLAKLGWSNRRIARLILPRSHHTISDYYAEACEKVENGELPISAKDEKALRVRYCGDTKSLEYIKGKIDGNQCGGGRRVKPHTYSDEWTEESSYDA